MASQDVVIQPLAVVDDKKSAHKTQSMAALTLGALGVVYGDIGTSPLYTFQEIFRPATGVALDSPHIIGAVSASK